MDRFPSVHNEQGFKDGKFHSFRHFFCSNCVNACVPERMVMERLGQQDSEMLRHYYHLNDQESGRRMGPLNPLGSDVEVPSDEGSRHQFLIQNGGIGLGFSENTAGRQP